MFTDLLMFYFTYSGIFYICHKLFFINFSHFPSLFKRLSSYLILSLISYTLKEHLIGLTYLIPLLILWLYFVHITERPNSLFSIIISFGLSYGIWGLANLFIVLLFSPLYNFSTPYLTDLLTILVAILHTILIKNLLKNKRFQKGIHLFHSYPKLNSAFILSVFFIIFLYFRTSMKMNIIVGTISLFVVILFLAFLIHWWQAQITKSYKRSLQLRELESLRMELEEKEKQIAALAHQNEELGRLIHKDNKLIPAMEHAVREYFITDFSSLNDAKHKAQTLLLEIETLSHNRNNILLEIHNAHSKHYETGIPSVDTLLNYMDKRAHQELISLSVHLGVNITDYVPNNVSADDLTHMLSDLLENAIIACKGIKNATIQIQFYVSEKAFIVEIADNGIPFEVESLSNFGIAQFTTHANSGGSGIGLMDIWKIKEKYNASLHITEFEANTPFSKKIAVIFNRKHRYSISTHRKEQLSTTIKRVDLHIFD